MSTDYEKMSDRELDAMVHTRVMGKEPEIVWIARADDDKPDAEAGAFLYTDSRFDSIIRSRDQIEKWIAEHPVIYGEKIILGKWLKHAPYTTDISAAWTVVEKMNDRSHKIEITFCPDRGVSKTWKSRGKTFIGSPDLNPDPKPHYVCQIMGKSKQFAQCWEGAWSARAPAAPRAICIAALMTLDAQAGGA